MCDKNTRTRTIAILELFNGGSHNQLVKFLESICPSNHYLLTLSDKKWHWRSRCGALQLLPQLALITEPISTLFVTSVGSLPELIALCPSLSMSRKVLYFHENQLVYPIQCNNKERDYQHGYNQIMSALTADIVLFNSKYNMDSFIENIDPFLNRMPDYKPRGISELIQNKSKVLHYPIDFPRYCRTSWNSDVLHIVWPHRWEHDKNPCDFFEVLEELINSHCNFKLSILGKSFNEVPEIFDKFKEAHNDCIIQWGPLQSRTAYLQHMGTADVVVSTAVHEFFGVAMLEGLWAGCFPLCPNRLSYPAIYPKECLYNTKVQLTKALKQLCKNPGLAKKKWDRVIKEVKLEQYSWDSLKHDYLAILSQNV